MDSVAIRFDSMAFQSFDCLACLSLVFPSFTLQGNDIGRIESLLALLSLSAFGFNFRADRDFLYGL